jgi:hypothetical protein
MQKARTVALNRAGLDSFGCRQEVGAIRMRNQSVSKSSGPGSRRQKQPCLRQHFLKHLPDPHGQRSLRPSFSSNSFSPWMTRTPRFTCVSEGNPRRRLLIVSKKTAVRRIVRGSCVAWRTFLSNDCGGRIPPTDTPNRQRFIFDPPFSKNGGHATTTTTTVLATSPCRYNPTRRVIGQVGTHFALASQRSSPLANAWRSRALKFDGPPPIRPSPRS